MYSISEFLLIYFHLPYSGGAFVLTITSRMFVEYLIQAFLIFLELIKYVIIVEIVLSWLILFGIQVRI